SVSVRRTLNAIVLALSALPAIPASTQGTVVSLLDFGARCDGNTDDAVAFQKAINAAANGRLTLPPNKVICTVRSRLNLTAPISIEGGGVTIRFDFPGRTANEDGGLFNIQSSRITFDGLRIDASGIVGALGEANRYGILADAPGQTRYDEIVIRNCRFTNLA